MFGVLNLNKPADVTSRDVVNVVQRLVRPAKVGHAGTLDPMATGVLLVCVGGATRLISLLQQAPKTYVAEFILGQTSDTDDSTGTMQDVAVALPPDKQTVATALQAFLGEIQQVPPKFSAVKVKGQRAYAKARRGEDVVLKPKHVTVHAIDVLSFEWPRLALKIKCGSGTYIRSIARDLGETLGCGGLMSGLERTRIGNFDVAGAVNPDSLTKDDLNESLVNPVHVVRHLRQYRCTDEDLPFLKAGRQLTVVSERLVHPNSEGPPAPGELIAVTSGAGDQLLAMAEFVPDEQRLQPRHVFVP